MNHWKTILAIDFDKWAAATYSANFPDVRVECGRVEEFIDTMPNADVLLAGFPCQPHSLAGERKASADERDGGYTFIAAIHRVKPRMLLGENVPGILSSEDGRYVRQLLNGMESAGYVVQIRELDAVNFGVPQFRNRVWFWGIRSDVYAGGARHCWPKPTHTWPPKECMFGGNLLPGVTVGEALGLNGVIHAERGAGMNERHGERPDHSTNGPCPTIRGDSKGSGPRLQFIQSHADPAQSIERPSRTLRSGGKGHDGCCLRLSGEEHGLALEGEPCPTIKAGGNIDASGKQGGGCPPIISYRWSDAILAKHPPASPASTIQAKYFKGGAEGLLEVDGPCPTISAGSHSGGPEPVNNRKRAGFVRRLTARECMRLQSAPDDFAWPEGITKTAMYRVAGNGWASRMGAVMGRAFAMADPQSSTVISLFCGGGLGDVGWHGRFWEFNAGALVEANCADMAVGNKRAGSPAKASP